MMRAATTGVATALLLFALAQPVLGESDGSVILIPFNPPLDRSLSYTVWQSQPGNGGTTVSVVRHYDLRFSKLGRGYRLVASLASIKADAPPAISAVIIAASQPLSGIAHEFQVSADGPTVSLVDPAGARRRLTTILGRLNDSLARSPANPVTRVAAGAVARLTALDNAALSALLFSDMRPLLLFASSELTPGRSPDMASQHTKILDESVATTTHLSVLPVRHDRIAIEEITTSALTGPDGVSARLHSEVDYVVDHATGLSVSVVTRDRNGGSGGNVVSEKRRKLLMPSR